MLTENEYGRLATFANSNKDYYLSTLREAGLYLDPPDWKSILSLLKRLSTENTYINNSATAQCAQVFFTEVIDRLGGDSYSVFQGIFHECYLKDIYPTRWDLGFEDLAYPKGREYECEALLGLSKPCFIFLLSENDDNESPIAAAALFAILAATIENVKYDEIAECS